MNLLFTITSYPPAIGGAQLSTHNIAKAVKQSNSIRIVSQWDTNRNDWLFGTTINAPIDPKDYVFEGIPVQRIGLSEGEKVRLLPYVLGYYALMGWSITHLAANLEHHIEPYLDKVDLIYNVRIGREPLSYASLSVAQKSGIPFVFSPLHHPRWSGWLHRYYHRLYRKADAILALTEAEKKIMITLGVDEKRVYVLGNGPVLADSADGQRFRITHHLGDDPFILFLGQQYAYKGLEAILQSTRKVWEHFPKARFVFLGPRTPYSKRLFSGVQDPRVLELGMVDLRVKTDALAACTLLCVPSTQESFGGVYTEAWSFRKPVIGCNIPAVAEVISDGMDGFLINQAREHLVERLVELLSDPGKAKEMGNHGYLKVVNRYNWEVLGKVVENIFCKIIEGK
jgi:glycosyltransferase involved in cell wall biosynthesis